MDLAAHGLRGGRPAAALSGLTEIGAGLSLALGLLTPLGAAGLVGVMGVAASTKTAHGFWVQHDGVEFPLLLAVLGAVIGISGPGRYSLDHLAGLPNNRATAVAAIGLGVLGAVTAVRLLRVSRPNTSGGSVSPR